MNPGSTSTLVWLDTGATGNAFAGLAISTSTGVRVYSNLTGAVGTTGTTTGTELISAANFSAGQWYHASFLISTTDTGEIGYTVTIGSESLTVLTQDSNALTGIADYVRMTWSPGSSGSSFQYDNLRLATIPEPSAAMLALLSGGVLLLLRRRRLIPVEQA